MSYSYKRPYLYEDYDRTRNTVMEREKFNPNAPERIESEFKKPYLYAEHPQSEQELAEPGGGFYPPPPGPGPIPGWDCRPAADAVGGGTPDHCNPEVECGVWAFSCCHKFTGFTAVGGFIQSVKQTGDFCRVVACWNEEDGKLSVIGHIKDTGATVGADLDKGKCLGEQHDPLCVDCASCENQIPQFTYTSQQMAVNGQQVICASGGGGGPYYWRITAGGGSLSGAVGFCVTYTAPATNPSCTLNPTIEAEDLCGRTNTVSFAVNADVTTDHAGIRTWLYSTGPCTNSYWANFYTCDGTDLTGLGHQANCGGCDCGASPCDCGGGVFCTPSGALTYVNSINGCSSGNAPCNEGALSNDCTPRLNVDVRTAEMITGGCCPARLL